MNTRLAMLALFAGLALVQASVADEKPVAEPDICERVEALGLPEALPNAVKILPKEEVCIMRYWEFFRAKPLEEILTAAQLERYREAIKTRACEEAEEILRRNFGAAHPDAPSILYDDQHYGKWRSYVIGEYFPDLFYCRVLKRIRTAQQEIDENGINAEPFFWSRHTRVLDPELPIPVQDRNVAFFILHAVGKQPQPIFVTRERLALSLEGRAIKYHPLFELFLAYALRVRGDTGPMIQQVIDRPVDPADRARVEQAIRIRSSEGIPMFPD